jgi:hypothetical protein
VTPITFYCIIGGRGKQDLFARGRQKNQKSIYKTLVEGDGRHWCMRKKRKGRRDGRIEILPVSKLAPYKPYRKIWQLLGNHKCTVGI